MANTTNFNWETPDDTDLVKDGAAAMRTLGNSIDTSFVDLKGGTTGQILSKASNTDLDYTWVAQDDSNAIQNAIVDAKGDIIAATANDIPARLAVGANDLVLTAASGEATGLKYTGGWTSYTPTLTNLTLGNGSVTARYRQIGKIVDVFFLFTLGSTSAVGSGPQFSLPITGVNDSIIYNAYFQDAGTNTFLGNLNLQATTATVFCANVAGTYPSYAGVSATVPFTWTTNDFIKALFSYEVA
jgi:hypothetical protein